MMPGWRPSTIWPNGEYCFNPMASQWTELAAEYGARYKVPPRLILALIDRESGGNPNAVNRASGAGGLMQVTKIALLDYNQRHNTKHTMANVLHPDLNVQIGAELLSRIADNYAANNGLKIDWRSRPFVDLVVLGWNAGYSQKNGVGRVLVQLATEKRPRTAAEVVRRAEDMGGVVKHLKNQGRLAWTFSVTNRFLGARPGDKPKRNWKRAAWWGLGIATVAGVAWWAMSKPKQQPAIAEAPNPAPPPQLPNPYAPPPVVVIKANT